jgi:signal transduction histidine kinase
MLQDQESLARRFSHELHDELGQSLAAVKANLNLGKPEDWAARRADCVQLVDAAIANVRELSQLLHPVILDDFGLDAGLRWLAEGFEQRTGISTRYLSDFRLRLRDDVETHLFRIAQEALTNVARHANARSVRVELRDVRGTLEMAIEDDGLGLGDMLLKQPSIGMTGMRARAKEVGATLRFEQACTGSGLRVAVSVPLEEVLAPEEVRIGE